MLELAALFLFSPFAADFSTFSGSAESVLPISTLITDESQTKIPKKKREKLYPLLTDSQNAAYLVQDGATGITLYAESPARVQPIASITKLMTALIILEEHKTDEVVQISLNASKTPGAGIDLVYNEEMRLRDLVAAMIIPSANDAAVALAEHNAENEAAFVTKMNEKAEAWGLVSANFYTATGLDLVLEDGQEKYNEMTAEDVLKLARRAWANPIIKDLASSGKFEATSVDERFFHEKGTTNQLLGNFQGILGLKTGFTDAAGQCVVTVARQNGNEVFIVVLGSSDRFRITKQILAWIWGAYVW